MANVSPVVMVREVEEADVASRLTFNCEPQEKKVTPFLNIRTPRTLSPSESKYPC